MRRIPSTVWSRRRWLGATATTALLAPVAAAAPDIGTEVRRFHVCLAPPVVCRDPALLEVVRAAGIGAVWLAGFFYGHRPYPDDLLRQARARVRDAGLEAHLINIPLGHPGDSLDAKDGSFPLTPPRHWRMARRPDASEYAGTSLHDPATAENQQAFREQRAFGFRRAFVDDDFRLARSPGEIGGCHCQEHHRRFFESSGIPASRRDELLDDLSVRRLTALVRAWVEFQCDALTASFRAQQRAFRGELGTMIMVLGSEKAGIRLRDYRRVPLRVGEGMFDDAAFSPVKGKTDELFSVLFHRRFVDPERAFSETTAFPVDRLSPVHLAAKLVTSTLADVRHTMFMSGLTPYPAGHWDILGPAMRHQACLHARLAGAVPRGPLKHFWGEAQRTVGDDRPFSLWLAAGIPFEVADRVPGEGWTFLSDFDARELASERSLPTGRLLCRPSAPARPSAAEPIEESLPALFAFKRRIAPDLEAVPHVIEETPAVCAWYPARRRALVWNLTPEPRSLTVRHGPRRHPIALGPLEAGLIELDPAVRTAKSFFTGDGAS
ncbi:MAG TPA: hypothetical protein PKM73_00555 [Verrucomicrobiota bacterium]|nr:hypothetical protein [Verrucomicrobiota bacterium]HNU49831.1 hypothetical protein [Verrucomicrobiota bacterium]